MRTYNKQYTHQQYVENICSNLTRWLRRKSRKISQELKEAALILTKIHLDSVEPYLESLYSPNPRGRTPYNPVCMLRSLLLMTLLRYTSIEKWAAELEKKPRLAVLCGFASHSGERVKTPAASTFYLFIDWLEDGEYHKPCEHYTRPSQLRKKKHLRNIKNEEQQRKAGKKEDLTQYDSLTKKLKDDLIKDEDEPRPDDLLKRLEDILIKCAIIPSARRGLLGDTDSLIISGDGSPLVTGASHNGKPACECRENGIYDCDCSRYYTDANADWGYDSYRDCYYFGHTYYQHIASISGHDLPLHVSITRASESDFTQSMKDFDRMRKTFREHGLEWLIDKTVYDSGHDSVGNYQYLMEQGITPVIALNPRTGVSPVPTGSAKEVNEEGIPICPGGRLMRRHSYNREKHRIIYTCPVKRLTRRDGKYMYVPHLDECPLGCLCSPHTTMGPVVYVRTNDDPRLYPPIGRDSPQHKKLMKLRSGFIIFHSVSFLAKS
ncbi:hypothetical protein GF312_10735 [Candidatus Poribacteria bacterium]|nr:hypothetical protein [Candidatus Poribacteria bacterium]